MIASSSNRAKANMDPPGKAKEPNNMYAMDQIIMQVSGKMATHHPIPFQQLESASRRVHFVQFDILAVGCATGLT